MRSLIAGGLTFLLGLGVAGAPGGVALGQYQPGYTPSGPQPPYAGSVLHSGASVPGGPVAGPAQAPPPSSAGYPRVTGEPCCTPDCCVPACEPCGPPGRCWVRGEYLLWWLKDSPLPPLVTTGPAGSLGILGESGTAVLVGGRDQDLGGFSGGRFAVGAWLDCCQTCGVELGGFFLGNRGDRFDLTCPPGSRVLARPFFNSETRMQDSEIVCLPEVAEGSMRISLETEFWGLEANALKNICCGCNYRVDLLAGFRYLRLDEGLNVTEQVTAIEPEAGGTSFLLADTFHTRNHFYGGQVGARLEARRGRFFLDLLGKVALGTTHQVVAINGSTQITAPGEAPVSGRGGLLALPSNIGSRSQNQFAVVPEVGMNVGVQLTNSVRGYVGYTFLYWSDVARPGDQVSLALNPAQLPPAAPGVGGPPIFRFRESDFWAHGINFGLELRY